jgi:hypothetical protein
MEEMPPSSSAAALVNVSQPRTTSFLAKAVRAAWQVFVVRTSNWIIAQDVGLLLVLALPLILLRALVELVQYATRQFMDEFNSIDNRSN